MEITKYLQDKINLWETGSVSIVDGLNFYPMENIKKIIYYGESKYLSGQKDSLRHDKPIYNIVNHRVNLATRATDIDTKDINIVADEPQFASVSFILNKEVYNWMKDVNFGKTLNEIGYTRAKFGGVLVKKCIEKDEDDTEEKLEIDIVDWRNVIVDPTEDRKSV